ncbi:MAG: nuclear transport factor 2 family protein [Acidobacteria bacterium]|nr:nuclear transport factor 2 family protein [Acidobacteriota bacterium]
MRKILLIGVVFVTITVPTFAQTKDELAIQTAVQQFTGGMEKGDMKMIEAVWANDENITVFEGGGKDQGWTNYRDKHLAPEMKAYKNLKYELSEIMTKVNGKMGLVRSRYVITGEANGAKVESKGLITAVLEKRSGKWLIIHWHLSASRRPAA